MDDPQIDSSITEIKRLFSTFAGLNLSLLQTQSEWDNDLQQVRTSRISLTKTVRGEPSQLADLKKAVSKLIKILLMRMSE